MPVEMKQIDPSMIVVAVSGRLVLGREVERLETVVKDICKQTPGRVVFDLTGLDYADSAGIGTFVACLTLIKKSGGDMRLACVNARIKKLFQLTGIDSLMAMFPTVAEATG
jgi:anti-sigma B factor antagonist